jgi:hypothetical protein
MSLCSLCSRLNIEEFAYRDKPKHQPFGMPNEEIGDEEKEESSDSEDVDQMDDEKIVVEQSLKDHER